jgi:predicted RNase H-like nuclease (RuvC/YqgF family)
MQSQGKQVVEQLNKQLESMHAMFGKISGGSYELKGSDDGPPSDADARIFELERQLQDARKENDKLRRQLAEMEKQTSQLRYVMTMWGVTFAFRNSDLCKFTTSPCAEREEMCSMSQRRPEIVGGKDKCRS